jgi:hypothetical protein
MENRAAIYDNNQEPIVLSKATLDRLLKEDKPGDLIALYTFYYYTAKWQGTNQARATKPYVTKGLGWGEDRYIRASKKLLELKLIETVIRKKPDGTNDGYYIKVNFLFDENYITASAETRNQEKQVPGFDPPNAFNTNNTNALKTGSGINPRATPKSGYKKSGHSDADRIVKKFERKLGRPLLRQTHQRRAAQWLISGKDRNLNHVFAAIDYYFTYMAEDKYAAKISDVEELWKKYQKIIDHAEQETI